MQEIFIRADTEKVYEEIVVSSLLSPWGFLPPGGLSPSFHFREMKKHFHGNSKIILHLYYNDITGKYEMQATTAAIQRTYPQYRGKRFRVVDWDAVNYEKCCEVFGEK